MKIVVLDDSTTVLLTMQALLEDLGAGGDEIRLFKSGRKALKHIAKHGADIIFSDIQMPELSGYEFVEQLLELSRRFVPTLFVVSADENDDSRKKMKTIGAHRFIRKPIEPRIFNHFVAPEIDKIRRREQMSPAPDKKTELAVIEPSAVPPQENGKWEALADRIGLPVKYIARLVESFIRESKTTLPLLEMGVEERDFGHIRHYAHSMKGSTGNMKFESLYEKFAAMERAALAEDYDFTYGIVFEEIRSELETVISELES